MIFSLIFPVCFSDKMVAILMMGRTQPVVTSKYLSRMMGEESQVLPEYEKCSSISSLVYASESLKGLAVVNKKAQRLTKFFKNQALKVAMVLKREFTRMGPLTPPYLYCALTFDPQVRKEVIFPDLVSLGLKVPVSIIKRSISWTTLPAVYSIEKLNDITKCLDILLLRGGVIHPFLLLNDFLCFKEAVKNSVLEKIPAVFIWLQMVSISFLQYYQFNLKTFQGYSEYPEIQEIADLLHQKSLRSQDVYQILFVSKNLVLRMIKEISKIIGDPKIEDIRVLFGRIAYRVYLINHTELGLLASHFILNNHLEFSPTLTPFLRENPFFPKIIESRNYALQFSSYLIPLLLPNSEEMAALKRIMSWLLRTYAELAISSLDFDGKTWDMEIVQKFIHLRQIVKFLGIHGNILGYVNEQMSIVFDKLNTSHKAPYLAGDLFLLKKARRRLPLLAP
jgi:hypothetical protein